jgi:hypothetical protein
MNEQNSAKARFAPNGALNKLGFILLALVGCAMVPFAIHWCNAELEFESGLKTGMLVLPIIPATFFWGIVACFVITATAAWLAGRRSSFASVMAVSGMAVFFGVAGNLASGSVGRNINSHFLDGFKDRVVASGIESNAVEWANQVFADHSLNPSGYEEIHLAHEKVPTFFLQLFNGTEPPEAVVCYGKDKLSAEDIEIRMRHGVDWGLIIVKDPNSVQHWEFEPQPQLCGKGLYVYVYYYK